MVAVGCGFAFYHYTKQVPEWLCNQVLKPSFQYVVKFKKWQTCFRTGRLDQHSWQNGLLSIKAERNYAQSQPVFKILVVFPSSLCKMQFAAT